MTSDELRLRALEKRRDHAVNLLHGSSSSNRPISHLDRTDAPGWSDWLYYAGKPEEWTVKALAAMTGIGGEEYEFGSGHDFYDQPSFASFLHDAGLPLGAAIPLGILAAILNPADPLNVASITKLTKAGVVGSKLNTALALGATRTTALGHTVIDVVDHAQRLKKLAPIVRTSKRAAKSFRQTRQALLETRKLNESLVQMQKMGLSIPDIQAAATPFEQIAKGQRHLLSLNFGANPVIRGARRLFRLGKAADPDPFLRASSVGFKGKAAGEVVKMPYLLGAKIKSLVVPTLNKFGATIPTTTAARLLKQIAMRMQSSEGGDLVEIATNGIRELNIAAGGKLTKADMLAIMDVIEGPDELIKRLIRDVITEAPDARIPIPKELSENRLRLKGSAPTNRQRTLLNSEKVGDDVAKAAVEKMKSSQLTHVGSTGHQIFHDGDTVVVKLGRTISKKNLGRKPNIPGVSAWNIVDDDTGRYIVAPWSGGTLAGNGQKWGRQHIDNLEAIAALLAKKKIGLVNVTAADVLVGPAGEVQIINPDVLAPMKSFDSALSHSQKSLEVLIDRVKDLPRSELPLISDPRLAKQVRKSNVIFKDESLNADRLVGDKVVNYRGTTDLVGNGNNVRWIQALDTLDEETLQTIIKNEGIDVEMAKLQDLGVAEPIEFAVDAAGNVEIVAGTNRLAAAHLLNFDMVPARQVDYTGEIAKNLKGERVVMSPTRSIGETLSEMDSSTGLMPERIKPYLDERVRVLGPNGIEQIDPEALNVLANHPLFNEFKAWYTRLNDLEAIGVSGRRADNLLHAQSSILDAALLNHFKVTGHQDQAALLFADLLNSSRSPDEFFAALKDSTGINLGYSGINRKDRVLFANGFPALKERAAALLEDLATEGVFTPSAGASNLIETFSRNSGKTVVLAKDDGLHLVNRSIDDGALYSQAEEFIRQEANDLAPGSNLVLDSSSGSRRVGARQLVGESYAETQLIDPANTRFFISKEDVKTLRAEGVVHNPTAASLAEVIDENAGKLVQNPEMAFFVSRSGDLFVSHAHNDVPVLLNQVFGEATKHSQEFGVITKDTIYLNDVYGSAFEKLTKSELVTLEKRLYELARRFKKAGFVDDFRVGLNLPFNDQIVNSIIPTDLKIGDILTKRGKVFTIDDVYHGLPTQLVDTPVAVGIGEKADRLPEGPIRELFRWAVDEFDAQFIKQMEAGLPISYTTNYYARILSNDMRKRMDSLVLEFGKGRGIINWMADHLKSRRFTDLTTREVNNLFEAMQKQHKIGSKDLVSWALKHDSQFMKALAAEAPEAAEFFITDPVRAVVMHSMAVSKSVNRFKASQEIADKLAMFSGSKKQLAELSGYDKQVKQLYLAREALAERIGKLEEALNSPGLTDAALKKTETNLAAARKKMDGIAGQIVERVEKSPLINGFAPSDLEGYDAVRGIAYINQADADALISKGVLSDVDILGEPGAGLVKVKAGVVPDGTQMHIFTEEIQELLGKWQALLGNSTGEANALLKLFDQVQDTWKQITIFPIPKYHVRNFLSNIYLGVLGGIDPRVYRESTGIMLQMRKWASGTISKADMDKWLDETVFSNGVQTLNARDMWSAWLHEGGISGSLHHNEFKTGQQVVTRKSVSLGFSPSSELVSSNLLLDNKLVAGGRALGGTIENFFRFGAFIHHWKKGRSFEEAGRFMKTIFYEYSELNALEKQVLRRAMPFYSWARHNIPRMLSTLVTEPVKHLRLRQMIREVERGAGGPADPKDLPEWLRDRYTIVFERGEDGTLGVLTGDGVIPTVDAFRILKMETAYDMALEMVTPFLKYPVEQITNHSIFTGGEIERAPGEPARSFTLSSLGMSRRATSEGRAGLLNILWNESLVKNIRLMSSISKWMDEWIYGATNFRGEDPSLAAQLSDLLIGRAYSVDPARALQWDQINWAREVKRASSFVRQGVKDGRQDLVDYGKSRLTHLHLIKE